MKIAQEYCCSECHHLHSATHYVGRFRLKAAASQLLEREVRGKFPYHRHASVVAAGMDRGTQRSWSRKMRGGKPGAKPAIPFRGLSCDPKSCVPSLRGACLVRRKRCWPGLSVL